MFGKKGTINIRANKDEKSGFLFVALTETALVAAKTRSEFIWSAFPLPGWCVPVQSVVQMLNYYSESLKRMHVSLFIL